MKFKLEWYYIEISKHITGAKYVYPVFKHHGKIHDWLEGIRGGTLVEVSTNGIINPVFRDEQLHVLDEEIFLKLTPHDQVVVTFLDQNYGIWNDPLWDRKIPGA